MFKFIDEDNPDGCIDINEFRKLFKTIGIDIPDNELKQLFEAMDFDKSGSIEYHELLNYIRDAVSEDKKIKRSIELEEKA